MTDIELQVELRRIRARLQLIGEQVDRMLVGQDELSPANIHAVALSLGTLEARTIFLFEDIQHQEEQSRQLAEEEA